MNYFNTIDQYQLDGESWIDIPNYEGIYQASDFGRVRSVDGKLTHSKLHGFRRWKGRVIKPKGITPKTGYRVSLWKNGQFEDYLVARLVGYTFLGKPKQEKTINHIDGNRFNNHIDNLEWLTLADNIRHAFDTGLVSTCQPITLVTPSDTKHFRSMAMASRHLGRTHGYISNQLKNNKKVTDKQGNVVKVLRGDRD